jgi:hypothetical protein
MSDPELLGPGRPVNDKLCERLQSGGSDSRNRLLDPHVFRRLPLIELLPNRRSRVLNAQRSRHNCSHYRDGYQSVNSKL